MRSVAVLILLVLVAVLGSGCGGGDDDADDTGPAPLATPESVRTTVWERSFSECSSTSLKLLAGKYGVDPVRTQVTLAVGEAWSERFNGGQDAIRAGRDGCRQGLGSK